ncbi:MAG: hypothetical protein N2Z63_02205 [Thiobacillaceae bacterium]|nr:hypothetical protein [Thiobacillaceae bacterium]
MTEHAVLIVIPVADRPRQLAECLASLARLRAHHPYGGRVELLIADDSLEPAAAAEHRAVAAAQCAPGMTVHHLDRGAQHALHAALPPALRERLAGVIGVDADGRQGASVLRNLALLWIARHYSASERLLIWFVDSDERFQLEAGTDEVQPDYLGAFDRLFADSAVQVATGKVVGDPPVAPAVMAGTLLEDLTAALERLTPLAPDQPCPFHDPPAPAVADAAYHDMLDLFGYRPPVAAQAWSCPLCGPHAALAGLAALVEALPRFFDGVHPTRAIAPAATAAGVQPARTVYTGNYVLRGPRPAWFIPFAALGLRMAGPALGRLLRTVLGPRFISVPLPLQHGRALAALGRSECRPGVERLGEVVELAAEFERQYWGDVLLFTVEALTAQGYPEAYVPAAALRHTLEAVEARLYARYAAQQQVVGARLAALRGWLADPPAAWRGAQPLVALDLFARQLAHNFGPTGSGWRRVHAPEARASWRARLAAALADYPGQRRAWAEALARLGAA